MKKEVQPIEKLQQMFPNLEVDILKEILNSTEKNLDIAIDILLEMGQVPEKVEEQNDYDFEMDE